MASFVKCIRLVLGAWAFFLILTTSMPSNAQQVNPTASSVKEQQLLQELNRVQGRVSIPDQRSGVLDLYVEVFNQSARRDSEFAAGCSENHIAGGSQK